MNLWELLVIVIVALIVFGPEKMPELSRNAGRLFSRFKKITDTVQSHLDEQVKLDTLEKNI
ncbi:MAG: twin-arginine translocase subunit TatB, partial [Proteobacteria bacterium]|nr:twin-arginine translocase subunit TatB [Pseudomonadota bacterium]